jgi:hypothetical protein
VLVALALDEIGLGILVGGPGDLAAGESELELRQVLALEERIKVARREAKLVVIAPHCAPLVDAPVGMPRTRS